MAFAKEFMQIDLIKDLVSNIIGKDGEKTIDILYRKKNVNEFLISKKLNLTINQTRNLLYKLLDKGLVNFIRKKDSKKGGWYTYFWTLSIKKSLELLKEQINNKIKKLQEELERRLNQRFYYSPGAGIEYTEEEALENNFICPETGEVLVLKDNKTLTDSLDVETTKVKLLYEEIIKELEEVDKKREIEKNRRIKVETKKKETERKAKREKTKKLKAKMAKDEIKKSEKKNKIKKKDSKSKNKKNKKKPHKK